MKTPTIKQTHVILPTMIVKGYPSIAAVSHDIWRHSEGIGLHMARSSDVFSRRCKFGGGLYILIILDNCSVSPMPRRNLITNTNNITAMNIISIHENEPPHSLGLIKYSNPKVLAGVFYY